MSRGTLGKPLKGLNTISQRGGLIQVDAIDANSIVIEDINITEIVGGDFVFDPIDINSGTIDGVVIGADVPGPAYFSTIQTGSSGGTGFNVIFYGTTIGESVYWDANNGSWNIVGDLNVTGETDLGNLNITGNTITSTNTNGDIILDPDGNGCVTINSCINQSSIEGNVNFEIENGGFEAVATDVVKIESIDNRVLVESHGNTEIETHTSNIELTTEIGHRLCIEKISTGTGSVSITTKTDHNLSIGQTLTIYNSNSSPNVDGIYIVTSIISNKIFTINSTTSLEGNKGTIRINVDISSISIGLSLVEIITSFDHNLKEGDNIEIVNSNSTPSIDGVHIVNSVIDSKKINIIGSTTSTGTTGNITKTLNSEINIISPRVTIEGDINLGGGCDERYDMNIYSKNIKSEANIIQIGGIETKLTDDNKDRGVSFNWNDGISSKLGFYGFDDSIECFTFIPDATITNGIVSGSPGCINVGDITATQLDLQGGDILNLSTVTTGEIIGDPDIVFTTGVNGDIYLNAEGDVNIPTEVGLTFGGDTTKIEYNNTAGGLCIESDTNVKITPGDTYDVIIPSNIGIILDGNITGTSTQKIESNGSDMTINTGDLNLSVSGDVNIPENVGMTFGGDTQKIEYDGSSLVITSSGDINLEPTNDVRIPCDKGLILTGNTIDIEHKIESDCTDLTIKATKTVGDSDINLVAKTNVNIPQNVGLTFANDNHNIVSNGANISINSSGDIDLTATNDINIPINVGLTIGNDNTKIENNGSDVSINTDKNLITNASGNISISSIGGDVSLISTVGDIYLTPSDNNKSIIIPQEVDIRLGVTTTNITSDGSNNLIINSGSKISIVSGDDINLSATNQILIPIGVEMEYGNPSQYISGDGTNLTVSSGNNLNINSLRTIISGDLQVNGTTTTVNSTVLTIQDPIITLGGENEPTIDDNKDRGIEFKWHNGTEAKRGFFGFDDSIGCFTFIPDAINTAEVMSGSPGCMKIGDLNTTNVELNGGNITNSNIINVNELHGDPDLNLSATQDINLIASQDVNIPSDVGLTFGDDSNKIEYISGVADQLTLTTDGTYRINSNETYIQSDTDITLDATDSIIVPSNTRIEVGSVNNYVVGDGTDLCLYSLNDIKLDAANIELNATNSVDIPTNIRLNLNDTETSFLIGNASGDVTLVAEKDIILSSAEDVRIPVNKGLVFETTGTDNKIEYNGTDLCIDSSGDIKLTAGGGDINIGGGAIINGDWEGNTILATYGGTGHGEWQVGSVIFAGTATALNEDNNKFYWKDSIDRLYIGTNSASDLLGGITIANSGTLSFRNNFNTDNPGITFQNSNQTYTWNIYRSEGTTDNSNFHIAGGINQTSSSSLSERLVIEETGTVGINFPSVSASITSSTPSNPTEITSINHDLETGNIISITGADANPSINGEYIITVTSEDTFTIPVDTLTGFVQSATTGVITIIHADRVDNSNDIKLHVNGCIKLAQKGIGSSCLILGTSDNKIQINNSGDFEIDVEQDLDISLNEGQNINIPSNVGLTFSNDDTFIKSDGTDLCIESSNDIKMNSGGDILITPGGSDVIIDGNLTVTGTVNFSGGGEGGSGIVDDYIVCFGKGQDLAISSIQNGGGGIEITTISAHNLVIGDIVTISNYDSTPSIDGEHTIIAIISSTTIRISGTLTVSGTTGNLRSKHVTDPGKDVGVCISWHDGLSVGTSNANEGFFGFDRSTERFTFIPDATIVSDVITGGALGDAEFNKIFLTNAEVSSLTSTEVVFAGTNGLLESDSGMSYNSSTKTLSVTGAVEAPNLLEKEDFDANTILKADTDDNPVTLTVPENTIVGRLSGGQITALNSSEVNSILGTGGSFERINVRVETNISTNSSAFPTEITTTTDHGYSNGDTVTISGCDAVPDINGTYIVTVTASNKFSIPVDTTVGYIAATTGSVTPSGPTVIEPDVNKQVTFVNLTGIGTGVGSLTASTDGAFKMIILSSIPTGSSYELTLTLTDPGNATTSSRKLVFTCSGQSSHLIYDNVINSWFIVNSGAFVV